MDSDFKQKISKDTFAIYLVRFSTEFGQPVISKAEDNSDIYAWETENFKFCLLKSNSSDDCFYSIESFCDKSPLEFQHELRVKPDF